MEARYYNESSPLWRLTNDILDHFERLTGITAMKGVSTTCSRQLVDETKYFIAERDLPNVAANLLRLGRNYYVPVVGRWFENKANVQQEDGSWGYCASNFPFKVEFSADRIGQTYFNDDDVVRPHKPFKFLSEISTPEKLQAVFDKYKSNRKALNNFTGVIKLIYSDILLNEGLVNKEENLALKAKMAEIVGEMQDKKSGCFGFRKADGTFVFDLSKTFHILKYCRYAPEMFRWDADKIATKVLSVKNELYPRGWLEGTGDGKLKHAAHHDYDVVWIFKLIWDDLGNKLRKVAADEIADILNNFFKAMWQPDGSIDDPTHSADERITYATSLLDITGYFDREKCFWLSEARQKDFFFEISGSRNCNK